MYNIGDITGLVNITFGGNLPRCQIGDFINFREVSYSGVSTNLLSRGVRGKETSS